MIAPAPKSSERSSDKDQGRPRWLGGTRCRLGGTRRLMDFRFRRRFHAGQALALLRRLAEEGFELVGVGFGPRARELFGPERSLSPRCLQNRDASSTGASANVRRKNAQVVVSAVNLRPNPDNPVLDVLVDDRFTHDPPIGARARVRHGAESPSRREARTIFLTLKLVKKRSDSLAHVFGSGGGDKWAPCITRRQRWAPHLAAVASHFRKPPIRRVVWRKRPRI